MHVRSLHLINFRNYGEKTFYFSPRVNGIHGPNGAGKTTVLEALFFLITGRSFRTSKAADMIKHGENYFFVEAHFSKHGLEQRIQVGYSLQKKKVLHNNTSYHTLSSLLGILQGFTITPDDLSLVKGAPQQRRHFLDMQLSQVDPLYVHHLMRYNQAIKQRNLMLRKKMGKGIECFEEELAKSAAYITTEREKAEKALEKQANPFFQHLTQDRESLSLHYKTSWPKQTLHEKKKGYINDFNKYRAKEMILGSTQVGPHKDDLEILINGKQARNFASEGGQKSSLAALRLGQWHEVKNRGEETPLLLIDDLPMSLDPTRTHLFQEQIHQLGQVFVTSTEKISFENAHGIEV